MKNINTLERKELKKLTIRLIGAVVVCLMVILGSGAVRAQAAAPAVSVVKVDYAKSTVVVQMDARDKVLFLSDKNQKNWEYVPVQKDAQNRVTLDISWVTVSTDYTMSFKGDYSTTPVKQVIKKQITNFKATYDLLNNKVKFTNKGDRTVQWRKKDGFTWNSITGDLINGNETTEKFGEILLGMCANGSSLIFRLAPDDQNRASKEVTVAITKKTVAPAIAVNDQYLAIKVEKGMQYRYADKNGNPLNTAWNDITKSEYLPLSIIAKDAMLETAENYITKDVYIQFRTKATSGRQISNIATVRIPAQSFMSSAVTASFQIVYTSSTTFDIKIPSASTETPYEYCIINQDAIRDGVQIADFEEVTWKKVTSNKVSVSKTKDNVKNTSLIYVRKAAKETLGNSEYEIATPWILLGTVDYPGDISTGNGGLQWLQSVAGVCSKDNTDGYINFTMKSPTDSKIGTIEFIDYKTSASRATLRLSNNDFKCTVTETGISDTPYQLNVTIMDTSALDKYAEDDSTRRFLAKITLEDSSEAFVSDLDHGIALLLLPRSKANNPSGVTEAYDRKDIAEKIGLVNDTDSKGQPIYNADKDVIPYTTAITRVYKSNKDYNPESTYYSMSGNYDQTQFRLRLDLGTRYVALPTANGEIIYSGNKVQIEKLKIDGVYIRSSQYPDAYTVAYADTVNNDGEETEMAVITFNAKVIENIPQIDDRNKTIPISIYLSNGEVLDNLTTINFTETATINGGANSWSVSGKLKETDTVTTKTGDSTVTTESDHIDRTIKLTVWREDYDVALTSVTWNGYSVATSICKDGTTISLDLSNKAINSIMDSITEPTTSYLVFTFNNGFVIDTGWSLTLCPTTIH